MNGDFYNDDDLRDIDDQISQRINQPTLVDEMDAKNSKIQASRASFGNELKANWYIYLPLFVSSIFTMMLGLYMGLAPYLTLNLDGSKVLNFNTDWSHIITAAVYVMSFVSVTEIGFGIFHMLYHQREEGNSTQSTSMMIGMVLAGISIIGTGISGGMVVSSTLGFLTEFKEIPASAQKWVVSVIPVMLGLYAGLFTAYKLSSRQAKAERLARESAAKLELDNRVRMQGIQAIGKQRIQAAAIRMYEKMVMDGLLSQQEADYAIQSGLSLSEIEKKLGKDLTGEGRIGDISGLKRGASQFNRPANQRPAPVPDGRRSRTGPHCMECGAPCAEGDIYCSDEHEAAYLSRMASTTQARLKELQGFKSDGNGNGKSFQ